MGRRKYIIALVLCGFLGVLQLGDVRASESVELSEGMYNWFLVQAYNSACNLNGGKENLWENEIKGKTTEKWIEDVAIQYGKEYLAAEQKFDEETLAVEKSSLEVLKSTQERYWNELGYGRYYVNYGITEEEFHQVLLHELKTDLLYEQEEIELAASVTEEGIEEYIQEHAVLFEYIAIPYEEKEDYQEYKGRLENGETIENLAKEIYESSELQQKGFSSSYTSYAISALYFDSDTSLTNGFWQAVTEADYNEDICFDDEGSQFYLIFKKVPFTMEWGGIDFYKNTINDQIMVELFSDMITQWSEDIEMKNEDILRNSVEIRERFEK